MSVAIAYPKVTVRRVIAAPREAVFDAWLDADSLAAWMLPRGMTHATATVEPREGGAYEIVMHGAGASYVHTGTYRVIDRPHRLVFTWSSDATKHRPTLVTVELRADRRATEVVVTHEQLPDADAIRSHTEGWTDVLDQLAVRITGGAGG
ncbi:MAG: SRPBCC domain-containing protein [Polyangiaceae bacterium]|nr:SRPBCC domain-containing protein [Polyangiaceae bacterium]